MTSSEEKIKSNILNLQVGARTCSFKNSQLENKMNGLASGQLESGFDQFMSGKLKSPSIIILGKGEDIDTIIA